jgi:YHS domain-containing protein
MRPEPLPSTPDPATATDPICGMAVVPKEARAAGLVSERGGKTYYFCNEACKKQFDAASGKR